MVATFFRAASRIFSFVGLLFFLAACDGGNYPSAIPCPSFLCRDAMLQDQPIWKVIPFGIFCLFFSWIITISATERILMCILAGILFVYSGGNDDWRTRATKCFLCRTRRLLVSIFAYFIVALVDNFFSTHMRRVLAGISFGVLLLSLWFRQVQLPWFSKRYWDRFSLPHHASFVDLLLLIIEFLLGIFSIFLTVSSLWAGVLFLANFGEEDRITKARKWWFGCSLVATTALSYVFIRGITLLFHK